MFYLLALVAGTASLSQTILIYQRYRKAVIRRYAFFLLSLSFILISFLVERYAEAASLSGSNAVENIRWMLQAIGGLGFIFTAPYFYHSLLGLQVVSWQRFAFLGVDVIVLLAALAYLVFPAHPVAIAVLIGSLFGMIAYGLVLISVKMRTVADAILKRALRIFLVLTLCFFPLMLIDSVLAYAAFLSVFRFLEGLAQPLYFLALNCLTIAFGMKYLNRPAYAEKDRLTEYFKSTFGITEREGEIILRLLNGEGGKEIGAALFISAKTVENHIYNLYQKLSVKNRVQLFQLIRANARE
jgi:DNA-binding CsgD family transcriptional regulator